MKKNVLIVVVSLLVVACQKQDETAPTMEYFAFNGNESATISTYAGSNYSVQARFKDDTQLNQAKLAWTRGQLFFENDAEVVFSPSNDADWTSYQLVDVSGKEATSDWVSILPDSIDGYWKMEVSILDDDGNLTSDAKTIRLRDISKPQFFWTSLSPQPTDSGWKGTVGEQIVLNAFLRDDSGLDSIIVDLNRNGMNYFSSHQQVVGLDYDLSQLAIPTLDESGEYELSIRVKDINERESSTSGIIVIE